ncbi:DHA2 family efflux MFS transporter permease subunit [Thermosulfuriphilus sp.]
MKPELRPIYETISPIRRAILTFIVMIGAFMAILDTTIVDVVIPKMMAPLATDLYGIQWVITAYMTAAAVGLLLIESLARIWGLKRLFLVGLITFTVSSALCGQATGLAEMITSRVAQGLGEAFIMASAQTILLSIYPPPRRGLAMGIFSLGVSFAPALGPTLGGWITEHLSWRWVFYVNLPVGTLNFLAAAALLPRVLARKGRLEFNFISYLFLATFTVSLLVLLSKGQQLGWFQADLIVYLGFVALIAGILYLISELLSPRPLIDFSIFARREYGLSMGFYFFVLGFSMYQIFYLLPLYYENLKYLSTFQTGLHMLAFAIFIGIFSPISGFLSDRIGPEKVLSLCLVIYLFTAYFLIPSLNYYTPATKAALLTIPFGISLGTFFAPLTAQALRNLGDKTSLGVSLMHYLRFVGGSFGTAIATNTLKKRWAFHYEEISALQNTYHVTRFLESSTERLRVFFPEDLAAQKAKALLYYAQGIQSLSHAFQDTFRHSFYFALLGSAFLVLLLILKAKDQGRLFGRPHNAPGLDNKGPQELFEP